MKRALFDILPLGDAIEQVCAMAADGTNLRSAVSVLTGMVSEVFDTDQLDQLDTAARQLWIDHVSGETRSGGPGADKMFESLNTAAGELHSYWIESVRRRIGMTPDGIRSALTSGIQPMLEHQSPSGSWFRVCFMSSSGFWLQVDKEWAYPLVSNMLSPGHPDNEAAWVGALYDVMVVVDGRLRSILFDNYKRLLANQDFFIEHPGRNEVLIRRFSEALWLETEEKSLSIIEEFAQCSDPSVLESFSQMVYYQLSRTNEVKEWPSWLGKYLCLRAATVAGDEAFNIFGAAMYNPIAPEGLELMKAVNLGGAVAFNSSHTVTLYSLLEARKEGIANGRIDTEVGAFVVTRLQNIVPCIFSLST